MSLAIKWSQTGLLDAYPKSRWDEIAIALENYAKCILGGEYEGYDGQLIMEIKAKYVVAD